MSRNRLPTRRRTLLAGLSATVFGPTIGATTGAAQETDDGSGAGFVLEQGEDCVPITPLSGDLPVPELYDWNVAETDYSSAGTRSLQRPDTSVLFLYRGPEDRLSLVLVHGAYDPDSAPDADAGGSVTMTFADLSEDAEWVVQDDFYDDPSNYDRWRVTERPHEVDWTWAGNRTDGGVLTGLGESPAVTIDPAFDGAAALAGEYYDGEVSDWQVLSGGLSDPARTSLAMDQPVYIRRGACGDDADEDDARGEDEDRPDLDRDDDDEDDEENDEDEDRLDLDRDEDEEDDEDGDENDEDDDWLDIDRDDDDEDDEDDDEDRGRGRGRGRGGGPGNGRGGGRGRGRGRDRDDDD